MLKSSSTIPRFITAKDVFSGPGSIAALAGLGALRTVILCTQSVYTNDTLISDMKKSIGSVSLHFLCLPKGEPNLELLIPLLREINEFQPDIIIGVGGGAALDSTKLLWLLYEIPNANLLLLQRPHTLPALRVKARFIAIPTTPGSGSEVSSTTVFTLSNNQPKQFIVSHELIPDIAILDSNFLKELPKEVLTQSCLDALSHAIEGYVSKLNNPMMDQFSETAIRTILRDLPELLKNEPSTTLIQNLMNAAMLAGNVQNFKVPGIGHAYSHQFGNFGLTHGLGCALMLPISMEINAKESLVQHKFDLLATRIGLHNYQELLDAIIALKQKCKLGSTLKEMMPELTNAIVDNKEKILADLKLDICFRMNPRELAQNDLAAIFEEAIG